MTARIARDRGGAVAVYVALVGTALLGFVALGTETVSWYLEHRRIQTVADAAAVAGALELRSGRTSTIDEAARSSALRNAVQTDSITALAVNRPPLSGIALGDNQAVQVTITRQRPPLIARLFLPATLLIGVTGTASIRDATDLCVLALEPTNQRAVSMDNGATLTLSNCAVGVNSTSSSALYLTGGARLTAVTASVAGDISLSNGATLVLDTPAHAHVTPVVDPYAGLVVPTPGTCAATSLSINASRTLAPGTYCSGITIGSSAVVTLSPGTYIINRGDLNLGGGGRIVCNCPAGTGVTLVFTSSTGTSAIGKLDVNNNGSITIPAPTTGALKGVAVFIDPRAAPGVGVTTSGGGVLTFTGLIYAPTRGVVMSNGSGAGSSACAIIAADTISLTGGTTLTSTGCTAAGVAPPSLGGIVRLVE